MEIDFGSIKNYNPVRGFGFVGRTFSNSNRKVFFHIKNIKEKYPELAQKLDSGEAFETVSFWYEAEMNEKGNKVSRLWLNTEDIPQSYAHKLHDLTQEVENIWKNVESLKPSWLDLVTTELVGADRRQELSAERDNLESHLSAIEEQRKKAGVIRENAIERIAREHGLKPIEANKLYQLLLEMRPLNFTHSDQFSGYIVKHQLGYKYQHISGILRMRKANTDTEWDFSGGFPGWIYRIICIELGLGNRGTDARAVKFTSFKEMNDKGVMSNKFK